MILGKKLLISAGAGIFAIILLVVVFSGSPETTTQQPASQNSRSEETPPSADKIEDGTVLVVRVIDGDTIELAGGQRVRYIGIDTPETVDPRKPVQCFGVEASKRNKQLVEGRRVRLEKDVGEMDRYGRLVRYVYIGDVFINLELVKYGFAYSYTYPPDVKYQDQFTEAERVAREQKKGLWGSCPVASESQTPATTPTPSISPADQPANSCTIKGNINSSGEKIYHIEGCGSYNATKIDEARGERWFCSETDAVAAGWRKAKNCP